MPRLTNADYLAQRNFVLTAWNHARGAFTALPHHQQLEVHLDYGTTENLSPEESLDYRQQVTAEHPSLPHRVGKLYPRLVASTAEYVRRSEDPPKPPATTTKAPYRGGARERIRIYGLARADYQKGLAKALLEVAREMEEKGGS